MIHDSIGDQHTQRPAAAARPEPLAPGTLIGGRYEILRPIGRGGMGEVYLCRDAKLSREVAVKRLLSDGPLRDPALERFRREAQAVAQLSHPNIVTLHDYDVDPAGPYLVMELLRGQDLSARVRADGPLPGEEVRTIALQVIAALSHAHEQGIIHRDIKPSNLFLQANGVVKVLDFGLARSAGDHTLSIVGAGLGTADYVAPEQAEDATKADARSDQFSLGATLYFMLTGKSPRAMRERDLPEAWRELVFRMAESAPASRYADLQAVRVGLQALEQGVRTPAALISAQAVPAAVSAEQGKSREASVVSSWAEVLRASVDRSIVTDVRLADQIAAVGLPWLVRERITGIEMVLIPPGKYMRGAAGDDSDACDGERPSHEVTISRAFYLGRYEVTQAEWSKLMGSNPSGFKGEQLPVESVSWADIQGFLGKSAGLRLPTEGEWEYACRAGTTGARYGQLADVAWYSNNSGDKTHAVGCKRANALGLHDMLGNVLEWCSDWNDNYSGSSQVDPQGPESGSGRVLRGGSWGEFGRPCRASRRAYCEPAVRSSAFGFRVARNP
jgi:formylglycine-generating enzyme required for sulfatase activity